jgi:predicted 3-demethylubiquinone-9 3-methyltransferase (glyoxalase superfamily)
MPKLTPFISYVDKAEEAAKFYCSIFEGSKITSVTKYPDISVAPSPGAVMVVELELLGQRYLFMNGGEHFQLNDSFSIMVECSTQKEIDYYWDKLAADGGKHVECGWLVDKFGLRWQIAPKNINELIGTDPKRAKRVMDEIMKMKKIDLATLEKAARG